MRQAFGEELCDVMCVHRLCASGEQAFGEELSGDVMCVHRLVRAVRQVFGEELNDDVCVHRLCASGEAGVWGRAADQEQQPVQHTTHALRLPGPFLSCTGELLQCEGELNQDTSPAPAIGMERKNRHHFFIKLRQ